MFNLGTWINNKDRALPSRRLPWCLSGKESDALFETRVESLDQEDPLERTCQSTPVFLPRGSHGQRSLAGCSPWGRRELDMTVQLTTARYVGSKVISGDYLLFFLVERGGGIPLKIYVLLLGK